MKTLFVLRHAKSSWDFPHLSDFERPLNKRGNKTAPFMGELMARKDFSPDVILSSPAHRAKRTSELVHESAGLDAEILFDEKIYASSTHRLLYIISEIDNAHSSAMIVGHNPGFEGIVRVLSGEYQRMPTAALAVIDLDIKNWNEVKQMCGSLREVLRPKEERRKFKKNR